MNPDERNDAGDYTFKIQTCVEYLVDAAQNIVDLRCTESEPFVVRVTDPCLETTIVSSIFSYEMSQPQLASEQLSVGNQIVFELGSGYWPWFTAVDGAFGPERCGPISYHVEPVQIEDPTQAGLVTYDNGLLTFAPETFNEPRVYEFLLIGTLWEGKAKAELFTVRVTPCIADIVALPAQSMLVSQ